MEEFFQEIVNFTGTLNFKLVITLFLMTSIGEFGISIPYLLETVWILTGYNMATGKLPVTHFFLIWLSSQAGRQTGAITLYYLSRFGSIPLIKLYRKRFGNLSDRLSQSNALPVRLWRKINPLSPFSVAFGRLVWLRIPLTLTLGVKRKLGVLVLAVLLAAIAWDGVYVILGAIGGTMVLQPAQIVLYSLCGLTVLYIVTFAVRRFTKLLTPQ